MIRAPDRLAYADANPAPPGPYPMGLMGILATVAMLFAAFTAAILMRRTGMDWDPVRLPNHAWGNAVVLVVSSVCLELARRAARTGEGAPHLYIGLSASFGVVFLMGQLVLWNLLRKQGVYLPSNPHASFIYMLSAVHGLHVMGGIGALFWAFRKAAAGAFTPANRSSLNHVAAYWHFVGVVWFYLLVILATL